MEAEFLWQSETLNLERDNVDEVWSHDLTEHMHPGVV